MLFAYFTAMNKLNKPQIALFGASPDTGNQGVTALCYSVINGMATRNLNNLCVYDHGRGRRTSSVSLNDQCHNFDRLGATSGRRYYRPENLWQMRIAAKFGGLWSDSARTLCKARAVLDVSGGDSFTEIYGPRRFSSITMPKLIAIQSGRPLILLPQTYGPFHTDKAYAIARKIVSCASHAWARDEKSFAQLKTLLDSNFDPMRHHLGVDMAFGLPSSNPRNELPHPIPGWLQQPQRSNPLIGFNVSGLLYNNPKEARTQFGLNSDYRTAILGALRKLLESTNAKILLVPHVVVDRPDSECDLLACRSVASELDDFAERVTVLEGNHDASELKWIISRTDWFCGTRMHATIAGLSSAVPTMALAYSMKTQGVFDSCKQGEQVVDLRTCDEQELAERIFSAWRCRDETRQSLSASLPAVLSIAARQMDGIARAVQESESPGHEVPAKPKFVIT
jgi:colanic acid/amylovoran biosynthesis protein